MSKLLTNFFNPLKTQLRTKILKHRGYTIRTDDVPLQVPENLPAIRKELEASNDPDLKPLLHPDYFNVHNMFTVADLFNARVHFGHHEGSLDSRMKPYIFGKRMEYIIFDLDKTAMYLRKALNIAAHMAYRDGLILFVGRMKQNTVLIENTAKECGEYAYTREWVRGIFTNADQKFKGPIRLPDMCILLNTIEDPRKQHPCVVDSAKMLIPTIAIVDSNANPSLVTYPVPGNDDSPASIQLYCRLFKEAIIRGKKKRQEDIAKEIEAEQQATQQATQQTTQQTS